MQGISLMEALWRLGWHNPQAVLISQGIKGQMLLDSTRQRYSAVFELNPLSWQHFTVFPDKIAGNFAYWHSPQARWMLPAHYKVKIRAFNATDGVRLPEP